ncbi:hypothetical protein OS189_01920 [Sulfitobacter sp. F26169L]|uniref:hypothetical protein n=1 Tax=Sulfitobacter sp. F26169L TaxID=2996015 RepID=UPI002260AE01|nr:hypothetical protein [Sulfitobacter sp. F26169L]MCX7565099.1 hypothetical protein [Sulfitobacter sp. F26169L]
MPDNQTIVDLLIRSYHGCDQPAKAVALITQHYPTIQDIAASPNCVIFARILAANNRISKAISVLHERIALKPDDINARKSMAVQLGRQGRVSEVEAILPAEPAAGNPALLSVLARAALHRDDASQCLAYAEMMGALQTSPEAAHRFRKSALRLQAELEAESNSSASDINVIAILGISFCGSTMLSSVLGALDGCENLSESHAITKYRRAARESGEFDFDNGKVEDLVPCSSCGSNCEVFDFEFRKALQADPTNRLLKICKHIGCKTVITADKTEIRVVDPLQRYKAVILFKTPYNAFCSFYKRQKRWLKSDTVEGSINAFLTVYKRAYSSFLNEHAPKEGRVFMHWDSFVTDQADHLEILCKELDLVFDKDVLTSRPDPQHTFGGNGPVRKAAKESEGTVKITRKAISTSEQDLFNRLADQDEDLQILYQQLMDQYRETFGRM